MPLLASTTQHDPRHSTPFLTVPGVQAKTRNIHSEDPHRGGISFASAPRHLIRLAWLCATPEVEAGGKVKPNVESKRKSASEGILESPTDKSSEPERPQENPNQNTTYQSSQSLCVRDEVESLHLGGSGMRRISQVFDTAAASQPSQCSL